MGEHLEPLAAGTVERMKEMDGTFLLDLKTLQRNTLLSLSLAM